MADSELAGGWLAAAVVVIVVTTEVTAEGPEAATDVLEEGAGASEVDNLDFWNEHLAITCIGN